MRKSKAFFITGTGTDIGKTAFSLALSLSGLFKGLKTIYFKPVQCGLIENKKGLHRGDGEWLESVSPLPVSSFCTYRFVKPVSPHLASESQGIDIVPDKILQDLETLQSGYDLIVVEGAGGPAVPLNRSGFTMANLAGLLNIPVILVSSPALGTISHTVTAHHYLSTMGLRLLGFVFCQTMPEIPEILQDNREIITNVTGLPFLGLVPFLQKLKTGMKLARHDAEFLTRHLSLREIF